MIYVTFFKKKGFSSHLCPNMKFSRKELSHKVLLNKSANTVFGKLRSKVKVKLQGNPKSHKWHA